MSALVVAVKNSSTPVIMNAMSEFEQDLHNMGWNAPLLESSLRMVCDL